MKIDEYPFHYILTEDEEKKIAPYIKYAGDRVIWPPTPDPEDTPVEIREIVEKGCFEVWKVAEDMEEKVEWENEHLIKIACQKCFRMKNFYDVAFMVHLCMKAEGVFTKATTDKYLTSRTSVK